MPDNSKDPKNIDRFEHAVSKIQEWFPDWVIMVREGNGLRWRSSNGTWARGACVRYMTNQDAGDEIEQRLRMKDEEK